MNLQSRYLSAALLLLIGILAGIILVFLQQDRLVVDHAEVRFTEIEKSDSSFIEEEELEKMGGRFLFKKVVDKVLPTVVYISSVVSFGEDRIGSSDDENDFWDQFQTRRMRTVGSGVIISEDGYIVTNNHVVEGAINGRIKVILNDKRVLEGRIIGTDPTTDLAVIKIEAENLSAITLGNSNTVDVGEWVLAIGNPFRLRSTVTAGIVSALSRRIQVADGEDNRLRIENFIQTDAAINKGNSGGALVNTSGQLIGINTAIATKSGSYQGYGFAVPSNLVGNVAADLIEDGEIQRALLGVSILTVDYARARDLGMESIRGVEITALAEDGAAQQYGLQPHDVILAVNEQPVNRVNQLQQKIAIQSSDEPVYLKIWRQGSILNKEVVLNQLKPGTELTIPQAPASPEEG